MVDVVIKEDAVKEGCSGTYLPSSHWCSPLVLGQGTTIV